MITNVMPPFLRITVYINCFKLKYAITAAQKLWETLLSIQPECDCGLSQSVSSNGKRQ